MERDNMSRTARVTTYVTAALGFLLALGLWFAWREHRARANADDAPRDTAVSATPVETIAPVRQALNRVSEAIPAELLPYEKTDIFAKVSGYLQEIRVDYGDRVKKGDVLAMLWVPELQKEFEQRKAVVARAEAAIQQAREAVKAAEARVRSGEAAIAEAEAGRLRAQAQYERWKSEYTRIGELVRGGAIEARILDETLKEFKASEAALAEAEAKIKLTHAALDANKAERDKAQADVSVAEANLLVAKADRDQVEAMLQYTRVVAPYDGVVTKRNLHTGAFIGSKPGEQPLLTIVRTDILRVVVDVPEKDVRYLGKDNRVVVDLDALPGKKFEWKITRLAPVLGSGKKVRVEADIPNPDGVLYPGMYGHASVILEEKPDALTVPAACVTSDDNGSFVWVAMNGMATRKRVALGLNDGSRAEITAGLTGTGEVICQAKGTLREGQPIMPYKTDAGTLR